MRNLLLVRNHAEKHRERLAGYPDLQVITIDSEGALTCGGESVTQATHPVHLAWFAGEMQEWPALMEMLEECARSPELQWVQTVTAGLDHPVYRDLVSRGIRLSNSDAQAPAIAEYVVGAVMHRYQRFPERLSLQQSQTWQTVPFRQLYDRHWLIIGFGNIGSRVGRIVKSFEARVTGVKRQSGRSDDADQIISFSELGVHVGDADVVVLSCALTDQTRHLVDETFLSKLKPGCVLVNISRGDVIDEHALLTALDEGNIDCAILDVFSEEPLPAGNPLWGHERVMVTPHASYAGDATQPRGDALFFDNLKAFLADEPLRNEVDMLFFGGT